MNKTTKWIYTALVCILLGAGLMVTVGMKTGWSFSSFGNAVHLTQKEFTVEEDFDAIDLRESGWRDTALLPAEDGVCRVVTGVSDEDELEAAVEVRGGVLHVERKDTRPWYRRFRLVSMPGEDEVLIYLPGKLLAKQELLSSSGDILVEGSLSFGRFSAESTSGDIRFLGGAEEGLSLSTGSGDIQLSYAVCGDVALKSTSGKIRVKELDCGDFQSHSTSGEQLLEDLRAAGDLTAQSTSGEQKLLGVKAAGALAIESSSGDVSFEELDAASVEIRTSSGSVTGTAARRMDFRASSSSGSVSLPEPDGEGGAFRVSTSSGDVKIRLD